MKKKKEKAINCGFTALPASVKEWKEEAQSMHIDFSTFVRLACSEFKMNNRFKRAMVESPNMIKELKSLISQAEKLDK